MENNKKGKVEQIVDSVVAKEQEILHKIEDAIEHEIEREKGVFEKYVYDILHTKSKQKNIVIGFIVALVLIVISFPTGLVLAKMLPGKSDTTFSVYVDTPNGSSVTQTKQVSDCVLNILKNEKEILNMELFLAGGIPLDYAGLTKGSAMKQSENVAEILVNLTPKHSREEPSYLMVQRLRGETKSACSSVVDNSVIKFIEQPSGPPALASIVVEVYGENDTELREISKTVAKVLSNTKDLVDVDIMADDLFEKIELIPNEEKVILSKLSMEQVNNILYVAFEGQNIAHRNSQHESDQINIFLVLDKASKELEGNDVQDLRNKLSSLNLMNRNGLMVPLNEIIDIKKIQSTPMIMSKNLKKMVNVVAETDMTSQVYPLLDARYAIKDELKDKYNFSYPSPASTYMFDIYLENKTTKEKFLVRWDGEMKITLDTFRDLGGAFIAGLVLIYILLVMYYYSFALAGIIIVASFLSVIGVIVGHFIVDVFTTNTFFLTATSLIGFIALMGISSRNSLLLIDFSKSLMIEHGMIKKDAIALAIATRAKPILLTVATIVLGSSLLASDPIFGGLGVALIFGSLAEIFISFLLVPIILDNSKAMDFDKQVPVATK